MRIKIGLVGLGAFSDDFVGLFKMHPDVDEVVIADLDENRVRQSMQRHGIQRGFCSYEELLEKAPEVDAIAIFTQRHLHGPMIIKALEMGKHVYSAVPIGCTVQEIAEIIRLVEDKRLTYMMGETCYYYPCAVFCRERYEKGEFGKFVYGESQYYHDICEMYGDFSRSGGPNWQRVAGIPPMFYPTHSTAMILGSMPGVYAKKVVALGFRGSPRTDIYGTDGQNLYNNPFSNTAMLLELSNGGIARISENRCVGWFCPETYISQFYGSEGGYEFSVARHHLCTWDPEKPGKTIMRDVTKELQPVEVYEAIEKDYGDAIQQIACGMGFSSTCPVQPTQRLPKEFEGLDNKHNGTHHFLIDDFMRAYETGKLSPCNIWQVARFNIPGLTAHQSALAGGVPMDVLDLGDPPADWEVLSGDHL